jgi:hypothetical protein
MTVTLAQPNLKKWIYEIQNQTPKTLAFWRVSHRPIVKVLEAFAATDTEDDTSLELAEVQALFDRLNPLLAEQEKTDRSYCKFKRTSSATSSSKTTLDISVVFGGKAPKGVGHSISEALSSRLLQKCLFVYTVSRSESIHQLPVNNIHVAKQNLDSDETGTNEFFDVMNMAKAKWEGDDSSTLVLYMTLAQFKGSDPFSFNLRVANNFCKALVETVSSAPNKKWKVVLTGTDATSPIDKKDSEFEFENEAIFIPTYKIFIYNFTYAMSKVKIDYTYLFPCFNCHCASHPPFFLCTQIGQYYLVAKTIAKLVGRNDLVDEIDPIISKISANIEAAAGKPVFEESSSGDDTSTKISMEELSEYSRRFNDIEKELKDYFAIAVGISICYTPLHAGPWTEQAIKPNDSGLSPKANIVEQIAKRLKNAISIEQAVDCHFP